LCILSMQRLCILCMSNALSIHHGSSSTSMFIHAIYPSSLGVIIRFLRLTISWDSSSSVTVELNYSIAVTSCQSPPWTVFVLLADPLKLFTFSINHVEVSSSPLAETISGF
jgi:hypothetical protein